MIRKATISVIAGKPPADAAEPSGIKGMIVVVPTNDAIPPSAPRTPAVLFQNPMNISVPKLHSETPRNQQAPLTPKTGYIQAMSRSITDVRNERLGLVLEPLLISEQQEDEHHRPAHQVEVQVALEETEPGQGLDERVHDRILS